MIALADKIKPAMAVAPSDGAAPMAQNVPGMPGMAQKQYTEDRLEKNLEKSEGALEKMEHLNNMKGGDLMTRMESGYEIASAAAASISKRMTRGKRAKVKVEEAAPAPPSAFKKFSIKLAKFRNNPTVQFLMCVRRHSHAATLRITHTLPLTHTLDMRSSLRSP